MLFPEESMTSSQHLRFAYPERQAEMAARLRDSPSIIIGGRPCLKHCRLDWSKSWSCSLSLFTPLCSEMFCSPSSYQRVWDQKTYEGKCCDHSTPVPAWNLQYNSEKIEQPSSCQCACNSSEAKSQSTLRLLPIPKVWMNSLNMCHDRFSVSGRFGSRVTGKILLNILLQRVTADRTSPTRRPARKPHLYGRWSSVNRKISIVSSPQTFAQRLRNFEVVIRQLAGLVCLEGLRDSA